MQLGSDKCVYLNIERGNQKSLGKFLTLDETKLAELTEGKCYKYLGQDENIGYNDVLNKERVIKNHLNYTQITRQLLIIRLLYQF